MTEDIKNNMTEDIQVHTMKQDNLFDHDSIVLRKEDLHAAAQRLQGYTHKTPLHQSRSFDALAGLHAFFKCEQFQCTVSFKYRGAFNKLASLPLEQRKRGVVAFSSGNHAQAVALAAQTLHIPAGIYMPEDAPTVKIAAVPVGGGGLLAGTCLAARLLDCKVKMVGVQTQQADHGYLSLQQQRRVTIPPAETIADGLRTTALGELNWPIIQQLVEDIILVSDEEISSTIRFLFLRLKIVVEPTGSVAVAAALTGKLRPYGQRAGIVLSGENIDPSVLSTLLMNGHETKSWE